MSYRKYGAKRTTVDGITFDSKAEARRFGVLKNLQKLGKIGDIKVHPEFVLAEPVKGKLRAIKYEADFLYYDMEIKQNVIEDVKGFPTAAYRIKKNMFLRMLPENHIFMEIKKA